MPAPPNPSVPVGPNEPCSEATLLAVELWADTGTKFNVWNRLECNSHPRCRPKRWCTTPKPVNRSPLEQALIAEWDATLHAGRRASGQAAEVLLRQAATARRWALKGHTFHYNFCATAARAGWNRIAPSLPTTPSLLQPHAQWCRATAKSTLESTVAAAKDPVRKAAYGKWVAEVAYS